MGAMIPTLALLVYNEIAFGSPWDMGYFHHVTFAHVHTHREPARPAATGLDKARRRCSSADIGGCSSLRRS